jgi:O6-methylguanine-DNA--protein-cysteine methyltransferase
MLVGCHGVIGANGTLTGLAGGLAMKERLLALEGALSPVLHPVGSR